MGRIFKPTSIVKDEHGNPVRDKDGNPQRRARTQNWFVRYYDANGKAHDESTGSTKIGDAKRLLRDREGAKDRGEPVNTRIGTITFDEAATDIVNEYTMNDRRSLGHLEGRIRNHLTPVFGGQRLANITTSALRAFQVSRRTAGASNAEINRELCIVKRMFTLAMEGNKLLHRPHIPMLEENNARKGFFERAEFEAVRDSLPEYLKPVATFMYITGWRSLSEVLPLQTRQVDLAAGTVVLYTSKNDESREFRTRAITELHDILTKQLAAAECLTRETERVITNVFHEPDGSPVHVKRFYKAWHAACEVAGYRRIPHDFRRTAVRNLVRAGVPEEVAMKMTGHKTRSVFDRYNITGGQDLEDAAQKLEAFLTANPATGKGRGQVRQFKQQGAARGLR